MPRLSESGIHSGSSAQAVDLRPVLGAICLALAVKCLVKLRARGLLKGKYKAKVRHPEKGNPPF